MPSPRQAPASKTAAATVTQGKRRRRPPNPVEQAKRKAWAQAWDNFNRHALDEQRADPVPWSLTWLDWRAHR